MPNIAALPATAAPRRRRFRIPPTLLKCATSSLTAFAIEFGLLILLVSVFHIFYLYAAVLATIVYLFINFLMNRRWAFRATHAHPVRQFAKHVGVAGVGMGLAVFLLRFFVHTVGLPYQLGWIVTGAIGFSTWTYPMSRLFTYGKPRRQLDKEAPAE